MLYLTVKSTYLASFFLLPTFVPLFYEPKFSRLHQNGLAINILNKVINFF